MKHAREKQDLLKVLAELLQKPKNERKSFKKRKIRDLLNKASFEHIMACVDYTDLARKPA